LIKSKKNITIRKRDRERGCKITKYSQKRDIETLLMKKIQRFE